MPKSRPSCRPPERPRPNRREREIAAPILRTSISTHELLETLVAYREEILKPFVELREDCRAMHDRRMEKTLTQIIDMLRGVP